MKSYAWFFHLHFQRNWSSNVTRKIILFFVKVELLSIGRDELFDRFLACDWSVVINPVLSLVDSCNSFNIISRPSSQLTQQNFNDRRDFTITKVQHNNVFSEFFITFPVIWRNAGNGTNNFYIWTQLCIVDKLNKAIHIKYEHFSFICLL